jgi:hypothetical protein
MPDPNIQFNTPSPQSVPQGGILTVAGTVSSTLSYRSINATATWGSKSRTGQPTGQQNWNWVFTFSNMDTNVTVTVTVAVVESDGEQFSKPKSYQLNSP